MTQAPATLLPVLAAAVLAAPVPAGVGVGDVLAPVREAHSRHVGYEVRGGTFIPSSMLAPLPLEAQLWYDRLSDTRRDIGIDGREFILSGAYRWVGSADGMLRMEWRGFGHGGPLERATTVSIWTDSAHLEGCASSSVPDIAYEFRPLTLDEQWEFWSRGRSPFVRERTYKGGYIELVRYALRILDGSEDAIFGDDHPDGSVWGRSDRWRVYLEADPVTGEVSTITIGIGPRHNERHEYIGRLPERIFPARHPERELGFQFETSDASDAWWVVGQRPEEINGYWSFGSATEIDPPATLFKWQAPEPIDGPATHGPGSKPDPVPGKRAELPFERSKDNPGRLVPRRKTNPLKTVLFAAGIALLGAGGILMLRRRFG